MSDSSVINVDSTVESLISRGFVTVTGAIATTASDSREFATGWLVIESADNLNDGDATRYCAVIGDDPASVVVCGPASEIELRSWWTPEDIEMPSWVPVLAAAHWKVARVQRAADDTRRALAKHQDKLETIVDAAHSYADDNNLCGVFDRFMLSQGLRPRSRDYDVTVDVQLRISLTQSGHDADAACENVSDDQIASVLYNLSQHCLSGAIQDYDIVDTDEI